jgi:hypothetical protein
VGWGGVLPGGRLITRLTSSQRMSIWPEYRKSSRRCTQSLLDSVGLEEGQKIKSSAWKRSQCRGWLEGWGG